MQENALSGSSFDSFSNKISVCKNDNEREAILNEIHKFFGLEKLPNSIVLFQNKKTGQWNFYIRAAGVHYLTKDKIMSEEVFPPQPIFNGGKVICIIVTVKVVTNDGRSIQDISAMDFHGGPLEDAIKKCATQASIRARKKAVGIGIPVETDLEGVEK